MLKLREWNEVLDYADQIEEELTSDGYNVRLHEYSIYNGDKGIYLTLYDNHNKVHSDLVLQEMNMQITQMIWYLQIMKR